MKPYPPQKVSSDVDRIRAQTWNQLIECLTYAMSHPRGDDVTVLNTAAGLLTAAGMGGTPAAAQCGSAHIISAVLPIAGSYSSGARIAAHSPVVFGRELHRESPAIFCIAGVATASAVAAGAAWGITQNQVTAGGGAVKVAIGGVTQVRCPDSSVHVGDFVHPDASWGQSAGNVVSGDGGGAICARALTDAGPSGGYIFAQLGPGAPKPAPYAGYFTISMSEVVSRAAVVSVYDGGGDSRSYAVVNGGSSYALPPYTETVSSGALYLLKYTPAQYGSGGAVVSGATMVVSSIHQSGGSFPSLPDGGTSGAYYYQLGRVIWSSGTTPPHVVQDHTAGVVYFQWFANCYLG